MKSIKGLYLIGVYSEKGATFSLEIDILDNEIMSLSQGTSRVITQDPSTDYFFKFYNWASTPIKFQLNTLQGEPQVSISTF